MVGKNVPSQMTYQWMMWMDYKKMYRKNLPVCDCAPFSRWQIHANTTSMSIGIGIELT
jgi:hypothetical protein